MHKEKSIALSSSRTMHGESNKHSGTVMCISDPRQVGKTHSIITEIHSVDLEGSEGVNISRFDSIRGFLVYVTRTYRYINTYLKGIHLILGNWRPYRDDKIWLMRGE